MRTLAEERMKAGSGAAAAHISNQSVQGLVLPGGDEFEPEMEQHEHEEVVEVATTAKVKAKKKDASKAPLMINKQNKIIFNGPINWESKANKDIQIINGSFFYYKHENLKFKNVVAEHDLTLLEAVHILIANAIENGMPEDMVQRYLDAKGDE